MLEMSCNGLCPKPLGSCSSPSSRSFIRFERALRHNSTMMTSANVQKMLPMLIPAFVPVLSDSEDEDRDANGVAAIIVVTAGYTVGGAFVEEGENEEEVIAAMDGEVDACDVEDKGVEVAEEMGKEVEASDVEEEDEDEDSTAVGPEASPSWARAEIPQV